jgi:hypothetical protein
MTRLALGFARRLYFCKVLAQQLQYSNTVVLQQYIIGENCSTQRL